MRASTRVTYCPWWKARLPRECVLLSSRRRAREAAELYLSGGNQEQPRSFSLLRSWQDVRNWRKSILECDPETTSDLVHAHAFAAGMAAVRCCGCVVYDLTGCIEELAIAADLCEPGSWMGRSFRVAEQFILSRAAAVVVHSNGNERGSAGTGRSSGQHLCDSRTHQRRRTRLPSFRRTLTFSRGASASLRLSFFLCAAVRRRRRGAAFVRGHLRAGRFCPGFQRAAAVQPAAGSPGDRAPRHQRACGTAGNFRHMLPWSISSMSPQPCRARTLCWPWESFPPIPLPRVRPMRSA